MNGDSRKTTSSNDHYASAGAAAAAAIIGQLGISIESTRINSTCAGDITCGDHDDPPAGHTTAGYTTAGCSSDRRTVNTGAPIRAARAATASHD
jgi:hypothetical protein